ncbi:MAG: peptidase domain-containing ABC transporter [Prevotellaceae bacterium]|jgi:ATP-binding cassette subfamily B protein|nr:peptidase domain-containing ABC transporter [Prevotellaceae bacterium]
MKLFPNYTQLDAMDCGATCLRIIAKYYGKTYSNQFLREKSFITREGVSMLGISDAAESIGFRTQGVKISLEQLFEIPLPAILHWNQNHFVVLYKVKKDKFYISDPAGSKYTLKQNEFLKCWASTKQNDEDKGAALLLEPTPDFYTKSDENVENKKSISFFFRYLRPFKSQLAQLVLGMVVGSILALIFPFLTQSIVDYGINNNNLSFVTLVLIAQLVLFCTQTAVNFLQSWLSLHINTRISINLISDFLNKLMKLPLRFFDSKNVGDIMQRIGDNERIKSFLTGNSITTLFSFFNFIIFASILAYYSIKILAVFLIGNILYILWITLFLRWRRKLDMARFTQASAEQSNLVQIVTGMQEIKLNNCEKQQRWKWESIQVKLFKISIKGLALGQYQQLGSVFFTQITSLLISYLSARYVIEGNMTLGMMMSVSYIIGQLSSPVSQVIGFVQSAQDAKISLERLNEVHNREDEEQTIENKLTEIPENEDIKFENISFSYDGALRDFVLENLNLTIPRNKITAIVGVSGSGKTTIVKLLLGFYQPQKGKISINNVDLQEINPHLWRQKTAAVLQDGFIFSDTIANNIAVGVNEIDKKRLADAVQTANIQEFIENLPLKYNTKIGMEGKGISQGQRQRLLIARAIYKNPEFLFFDEATNALDANNERVIMENLSKFFENKTAVIVAHRLSTVKNADKIIALDNGKIVEEGTHEELTAKRGAYYTLVKNQLELGT